MSLTRIGELLSTYLPYIFAIIGYIIAFVQFSLRKKAGIEIVELKEKYSKETQKKERQYQTYKESLKKIDSLNEEMSSLMTGEEINVGLKKVLDDVLENPEDLSSFSQYFSELHKFSINWSSLQNKIKEELHGLRLVASEQILGLLDEYINLIKLYVDSTIELMENLKHSSDFLEHYDNLIDLIESSDLRDTKLEIEKINEKIVKQMRIDIDS